MAAETFIYLDNDWDIIETLTEKYSGNVRTGLLDVTGFLAAGADDVVAIDASLSTVMTEDVASPGTYVGTLDGGALRAQLAAIAEAEGEVYEVVHRQQDYRAVRVLKVRKNRRAILG